MKQSRINGHSKNNAKALFCLLIIGVLAVSLFSATVYAVSDTPHKTIRIGFFPFDGYHMENAQGYKSGYGYEVLQKMRTYENWQYEYVGYAENDSWQDVQTKLEKGEIDMLTSATVTPARLNKFDYSAMPIGESSTMLRVNAGDNRYSTDDYNSWNNLRIGMLHQNSRNESFARYAADKGFTYNPIYFETQNELLEGLKHARVDMIVTSNLLKLDNVWDVDNFDKKPFYVIVRKGNKALLSEVNSALEKLYKDEPSFHEELYKKYYSSDYGGLVSFSREELAFIHNSKRNGIVYKAIINPDRKPLSYSEDGKIKGLLPDICREIFERTGMKVEFVNVENRDKYIEMMRNGDVNIVCDFTAGYNQAERNGYVLTAPFYRSSLAKLVKKNYTGNGNRCALFKSSITNELVENQQGIEYLYFDSVAAASAAVLNGTADFSYNYTRCAQELAHADVTNSMTVVDTNDANVEFTIGVNSRDNALLASIIKKSAKSITSGDINVISAKYTYYDKEQTSLVALFYDQPLVALFISLMAMTVIFGGILMVMNIRKQKKDRIVNEQLSKALSLARQASSSKNEFFSRMSHDMRTPMNGILGLAELAANEHDTAVLRRSMKKIKESGSYLLSLINDTLDFQRIESGKLQLEQRPVNCCDVMQNIIDMVRTTAEKKNIDLRVFKLEQDWYIKTDPVRLKQIFINLISNAIKFTPEGGRISIEYRCIKREGNISYDEFKISDTGIGMSQEFLNKKIFQPFSQEYSDLSAQYAGSGLGLSIVQSLVTLMGGGITVESELGKGTTFTVMLAFELISDAEAEQTRNEAKQQHDAEAELLSGKKILLVEDNPLNAEVAKAIIEMEGCEVVWAENGEKGVQTFCDAEPYTYDAILMDIRMPVMDGIEAAKAIRALGSEEAGKIPIIAMTANAYDEDVQRSIEAGMNDHLAKPIDTKILYKTLAEYFSK